ncbi:MAG: hypothetical protein ACPGMU_02590 [Candidatus Poseidoniaceae archaeon]
MVDDESEPTEETLQELIKRKIPYELRRVRDAKHPSPVLVPRDGFENVEFRPPEATFRLGIRYDSRENYQKFGHISQDFRYILTDDGDIYLIVDEESLNVNYHHEKNFRDYQQTEHHSTDARQSDLEVLLAMILEGGLAPSAQDRLIRWLVCGRLGI